MDETVQARYNQLSIEDQSVVDEMIFTLLKKEAELQLLRRLTTREDWVAAASAMPSVVTKERRDSREARRSAMVE